MVIDNEGSLWLLLVERPSPDSSQLTLRRLKMRHNPRRSICSVRAKGEYKMYRIPGIAVTAKGTALAFCEARTETANDWDIIAIMLRRSEDGGRT
jgi:hypothetical protein